MFKKFDIINNQDLKKIIMVIGIMIILSGIMYLNQREETLDQRYQFLSKCINYWDQMWNYNNTDDIRMKNSDKLMINCPNTMPWT